MCGIFGFYLNRPLNERDVEFGMKGINALSHRGPDNNGYWMDKENGIFLGHTRLVIIDPSKRSNQPLLRDGDALTYNGEIYNYLEIREELRKKGVRFETDGDAEVLFWAWRLYKEKSLDMFDGMYAFALYEKRSLHLVTDPFGEKPLYWAKTKEGIYFSSEPAYLARLFSAKRDLDKNDLHNFLIFGFLPPPRTGYRDIFKMPPAMHMIFERGGQEPKMQRYWTPPYPVRLRDQVRPLDNKALDSIQGALYDSLKVRVRSDVPWGVFLSSGIDSSLMLAMTVKDLGISPQCLTVAFPNQDVHDEFKAAKDITSFLNVPHTCVNAGHNRMYEDVRYTLGLYGELSYNSTVTAAYQMANEARKYMKMALSGIGGDEIFYGYRRHWILYLLEKRADILPQFIRKTIGNLGKNILDNSLYLHRISHFLSFGNLERVIYSRFEKAAGWLDSQGDFKRNIKKLFEGLEDFYEIANLPAFELAQKIDLLLMMPAGYIPAIERGSMRASLEVRTPYLNRKLLETVARFDQRSLIAFGRKSVLKRILERYLPKKLFDFPKKGFFTPRAALLKNTEMPENIRNLETKYIKHIWAHKKEPQWRELAIKLAVLDAFSKDKPSGDFLNKVEEEVPV